MKSLTGNTDFMPADIKTAVLIGAGNVAWHLGKALAINNIKIEQVISRTASAAKELANQLNAVYIAEPGQIRENADIYIIAVSDDAIGDVLKKLPPTNGLVVHTSGTTSLSIFEGFCHNYGVMYPLQTFTRNRPVNFCEIPLFIEANTPANLEKIKQLGGMVAKEVYPADSATRAKMHLAAVFACNFTNRMYGIAEEILASENIDFSILHPLIKETALKALSMQPVEAQTGPAVRGNAQIIRRHLEMLNSIPGLKNIYAILSDNIQKKYHKAP
ncbi:MAG: DUF2520 domain-containing protein [Bacteroidales bacterium]